MTKSHYPEFQKASRTIADIIINHQEKPRCVKCQKSLKKLQEGCANKSIKGFKLGKGKTNNAFSSLPFSFISGTFVDTPYSLLCYDCTNFIKRTIGMIPEKYDDKYFPQVSTSLDMDDLKKGLKKKAKWTIRFQGKECPYTTTLKKKFLLEGITQYKHDFPECPHIVERLTKLINGHTLYDKLYGKW